LTPSPGFGGSCLQKDLNIFSEYARARSAGDAADYWSAVSRMNMRRIARTVARISELAGPGGPVAVLGLTFKAGVADFRHSPALAIARRLSDLGHKVSAYDPCGQRCRGLESVKLRSGVMSAVKGVKVVALLTEWPEFRRINWASLAEACPGAAVYDGRQIADVRAIRKAGLACVRLGHAN
jgi:UDPglucose 6-dehydrogenase